MSDAQHSADKSRYVANSSLLQLGAQDKVFQAIVNLYDFAEQIVDTLESIKEDRLEALEQLAPLLDNIMHNARIITDAYTKIVNQPSSLAKQKPLIIKSLQELALLQTK